MSNMKRLDLEARAVAAEKKIVGGSNGTRASLESVISAAELYMQALRLTDNPTDKKRLDAKTKELISRAEELKKASDGESHHVSPASRSRVQPPASTRNLTTRENIILLEGSKLNGAVFKPWAAPPSSEDFVLKDGQELWADDFDFSLSETQLRHFDGWHRPRHALSRIRIERNGKVLPNEATMETLGSSDMVQDAAPDCSVVASLCVGAARAEKGHRKVGTVQLCSLPF